MSEVTSSINRVTATVINFAVHLIIYAAFILLLAEGVRRGYAFGYEIFNPTAMEEAPGRDVVITLPDGVTRKEAAAILADGGLVQSKMVVLAQMAFYEYDPCEGEYTLNTSMDSKELLKYICSGVTASGGGDD